MPMMYGTYCKDVSPAQARQAVATVMETMVEEARSIGGDEPLKIKNKQEFKGVVRATNVALGGLTLDVLILPRDEATRKEYQDAVDAAMDKVDYPVHAHIFCVEEDNWIGWDPS